MSDYFVVFDRCVICGSVEPSPQGGLCPRHMYDDGPQFPAPVGDKGGPDA